MLGAEDVGGELEDFASAIEGHDFNPVTHRETFPLNLFNLPGLYSSDC